MHRRQLSFAISVLIFTGVPAALGAQTPTARTGRAGLEIPVGAKVTTLDLATIRASGARTLPELLTGRIAGLAVTYESGILGAQPRIHIRGSAGIIGVPEPLLYVDGMLLRHDPHQYASPIGGLAGLGRTPAFDWEIPVEEIERVEVVMGAAGGALLEFGAARGAVLVTTRRPTNGALRVSASVETLIPSAAPEFESNYGTTSVEQPNDPQYCTLARQATGGCTPLVLQRWNPLAEAGTFGDPSAGTRVAVQLSSGLLGGAFRAHVDAARTATLMANDGRDLFGLSSSFARPMGRSMELAIDARLQRADGQFAPWLDYIVGGTRGESADDSIGGFGIIDPEALALRHPVFTRDRESAGANLRWTPSSRVTVRGRLSLDRANRTLSTIDRAGGVIAPSRQDETAREDGIGIAASATYSHTILGLDATLEGTAATRASWLRNRMEFRLLAGPGLIWSSATSARDRQIGIALRERLALTRTLSLALGARIDRLSAEGADALDLGLRPTAEASWRLSEEGFFPKNTILPSIRLHAAHGTGIDAAGVRAALLDPSDATLPMRLERFTESELGVEMTVLRGAVVLDVTMHGRTQNDALVAFPVGVISTALDLRQGAEWSVRGTDVRLSAAPIRLGPVAWQSTVVASFLSYGTFGGTITAFLDVRDVRGMRRFVYGDSFNQLSTTSTTWSDVNGDGIISINEVAPGPGTLVYRDALPTRILGYTSSIDVGKRFSMGAQLDAQLGHWKLNADAWDRCQLRLCRAAHDPDASLEAQARAVATYGASPAGGFYLEDASFVRFREAWVRVGLAGLLPGVSGREIDLLVTARNLATWTDYTGADPEAGQFLGPSVTHSEQFAMPLVRTVTVRLRMAW